MYEKQPLQRNPLILLPPPPLAGEGRGEGGLNGYEPARCNGGSVCA